MAELQLPKLIVRVRFPSSAPTSHTCAEHEADLIKRRLSSLRSGRAGLTARARSARASSNRAGTRSGDCPRVARREVASYHGGCGERGYRRYSHELEERSFGSGDCRDQDVK